MSIIIIIIIKDQNAKHGPEKTIILHYAAILGATLHKEGIGKNSTNMGDPMGILRMLAALFSGTWMTILTTTTIKDQNAKHGPGKTIVLHYTAILGANLHKEGIGKEW